MEIITGADIYWITRLNRILYATTLITTIMSAFAFILTVFMASDYLMSGDDRLPRKERNYLKRIIKWMLVIIIIFGSITVFLPSSKEMAMIKVIPAIANSKKVQTEFSDIYRMAKQGMEKLVRK